VRGGVCPSSWGPHGCHLLNLIYAKHSNVYAPVLQAILPPLRKELCVELDVIKPEEIFIDGSVTNTKVASMFKKLKQTITVVNKAQQSKPRSQQPVRWKTAIEEGARSSRPQIMKK